MPKFFELCPIVLNYVQHIFPGGASPGYGPADDACNRTFAKRFTLSSQKEIAPFYRNSKKKFASLAAIARYIAISYKIDYLQILGRVLF